MVRGVLRSCLLVLSALASYGQTSELPPIYDAWSDGAHAQAIAASTDTTSGVANRVRAQRVLPAWRLHFPEEKKPRSSSAGDGTVSLAPNAPCPRTQ